MVPRTKFQYEEIRTSRKKQIMDVAIDLFSREGFGHVSIAQLARKTGMSKGLMYNYFESKEMLLRAILEEGIGRIIEIFDPNHDGVMTSVEFEHFIRRTFKIIRENPDYWSKYFGLLIQPGVSTQLKDNSVMQFTEEYMSMLLNYLTEKGFEDPMLELIHLSAIIEGLGVIMIYYSNFFTLPEEVLHKMEARIINTYT